MLKMQDKYFANPQTFNNYADEKGITTNLVVSLNR